MSTNAQTFSTEKTCMPKMGEPSVSRRAAETAHELIDDTVAKAEPVEREIRDRAAKAGEKIEATQDAASRSIQDKIAKAEAFTQEQPLTAAGIAFAAGIVAAVLLRR